MFAKRYVESRESLFNMKDAATFETTCSGLGSRDHSTVQFPSLEEDVISLAFVSTVCLAVWFKKSVLEFSTFEDLGYDSTVQLIAANCTCTIKI